VLSILPGSLSAVEAGDIQWYGDIHASSEYRAHLVGVIAGRAVAKAG